ncbi:hypothetical protein [Roseovarius indicus]|uniref:hypothetical protein n=1 Tax=Roseovarius indicus TaxID=540747 RepID=UPI00116026D6|nr:hypothetical protein [Roseovarius indicus]
MDSDQLWINKENPFLHSRFGCATFESPKRWWFKNNEGQMRLRNLTTIFVAVCALAACDSYSAQQYQSSPQNVIALQSLAKQGVRASVGTVQVAEGVNAQPTCRLAGPLDLGGGQSVTETVKEAIQSEFLASNIYSPSGTPISVVITQLKPSSFEGTWTISMQVSSQRGKGYSVTTNTKFSTSFSAMAACNNTAQAFNRALSAAINDMVTDPRFRSLL